MFGLWEIINNTIVPVKGTFDATIYSKTRQAEKQAFVMNGSIDRTPLLSEATLLHLRCIKYDPEGSFQDFQISSLIKHINTDNENVLKLIVLPEPEGTEGFQEIRKLTKDKTEMFKGVGCFKKYQVHVELKKDAKSTIQKQRQIPLHYQDQTRRRLEEFTSEDIMEWCPADGAMTFVSPIHVCSKPHKPGEIRITADYSDVSIKLIKNSYYQNAKINDYINKLSQYKYGFKWDLPPAYHQLELDEDSRRLATMSTIRGNVRMKLV